MKITSKDILNKTGKVPPIKIHCSFLGADALKEAIYNYLSKNKLKIPKELQKEHERIKRNLEEVEEKHKDIVEFEKKLLNK